MTLLAERSAFRAALLELAEAVEHHTEWKCPSGRARAALSAAWQLLGDHEKALAAQRAGCAECGGTDGFALGDDICEACATMGTVPRAGVKP